jgi:hypothetical protein
MEDAVSGESVPRDRPNSGAFHPLVYKLLAVLAVWFVLSAWAFAGGAGTGLALGVVTFVFLISVGVPSLLALAQRSRPDARPDDDQPETKRDGEFGDWAAHEVELWSGPVKGRLAAIETVLPIAAVAFGMTAFALVLHFVTA